MTTESEHLKLLEKQPGWGHVVVLVGPDGGGKTFLANKLKQDAPDIILVKGTQPDTWPISDEDKNRIAKMKTRYKKDGFRYFGLLSLALHKTIDELARQGKNVVVDSEQTFKWLMWEELRGNLDKAVTALTQHKVKATLPDCIKYVVPEADNFDKQAELIWERQNSKKESEKSSVDPKNLEEVRKRLMASERVILAMEKLGVTVEGKPSWLV